MRIKIIAIVFLLITVNRLNAQDMKTWNNKQCAVVLTYDDAIDADLDNVVPALDSLNLKGTFYLIGSSPVIAKRMNEWRNVAKSGHELGNHSLFHPCEGSPGATWITADYDLRNYTVIRAVNEIKVTNTLISAIDGKQIRTFAYPCGNTQIGGVNFYNGLKNEFAGARGVTSGMQNIMDVDLTNIECYGIAGQDAEYMINLVKQAMKTHTLLVFLFHGVGGGHVINVALKDHSKLLHFLADNQKNIWVAPMVDVAQYIKNYQGQHASEKK